MKQIVLIITFGICSYNLLGQNYYPLIEEDKTWNVLSVAWVGPFPWDTSYSTVSYKFLGDTIINSKEYFKLYKSDEEYPSNWDLWCFMREDSNKRIWYRDWFADDESLMYDFSVEVGDSIFAGIEPVYLHIDSISVDTINQEERKKYWISCNEMPEYHETWIEGIGSSKGICWGGSVLIVGGWYRLLCMSELDNLIYQNPDYESCYLITGINEFEDPHLKLYPNPARNFIIIENSENIQIESISLINLKGQKIKLFDAEKRHLDITKINSGVYFISVSTEIGVWAEKIIIEK